jgi:hypothetical protein
VNAERGGDRPSFAEGFPSDPALAALLAAFARGDFGRVRRDAPALIANASSPDVRAAAEELLLRTRPDPLTQVFFLLTGALLVFLSVYWWWRARAPR